MTVDLMVQWGLAQSLEELGGVPAPAEVVWSLVPPVSAAKRKGGQRAE